MNDTVTIWGAIKLAAGLLAAFALVLGALWLLVVIS
jgi:hypothetical protein